MEQQKIEVYIDNLDVNTQADLLKKVISWVFQLYGLEGEAGILKTDSDDLKFLAKQIEEFNENYTEEYTKQDLKQFDSG